MAAKTDMERIGVFSESGYTTISDPYVPLSSSKCGKPGGKTSDCWLKCVGVEVRIAVQAENVYFVELTLELYS